VTPLLFFLVKIGVIFVFSCKFPQMKNEKKKSTHKRKENTYIIIIIIIIIEEDNCEHE